MFYNRIPPKADALVAAEKSPLCASNGHSIATTEGISPTADSRFFVNLVSYEKIANKISA
jgi:hypothetical protein